VNELRPIWIREPLPPSFPEDPQLAQLLASGFDLTLSRFKLPLRRCEARDLRKGLFGPKGSRRVPKGGENDTMRFVLPKGWTLHLTYGSVGDWSVRRGGRPGHVEADFIPPRRRLLLSQQPEGSSAEASP
jgi:hypothetical protein